MKLNAKQLQAIKDGMDLEAVLRMVSDEDNPTNPEASEVEIELSAQLATALGEVDRLKELVEAAGTDKTTAEAAKDAAEATASNMTKACESMRGIVMQRLTAMTVALGKEAPAKDCTVEALVAAYEAADASFKENFKSGRRSLNTQATNEESSTQAAEDLKRARMLASASKIKINR